jgi:PHD/YefM family antitoxin component YafN of YafNO toxin-antitoxin module
MLDISRDIKSLTAFKRNTLEFIHQLKETGKPIVLTINGEAELVVQDAKSYQKLLELVDRLETLAGIRAGIEDMRAGRTKTVEELRQEFRAGNEVPG